MKTTDIVELVVIDGFILYINILGHDLKDWQMVIQTLASAAAGVYTCIRIGQWVYDKFK